MKKDRRLRHNQPESHKERIILRKVQRGLRISTSPVMTLAPIPGTYQSRKVWSVKPIKTGKYIPSEEDKKHSEVRN